MLIFSELYTKKQQRTKRRLLHCITIAKNCIHRVCKYNTFSKKNIFLLKKQCIAKFVAKNV